MEVAKQPKLPTQRVVAEVNHEPMMAVIWLLIQFLATDVGVDHLSVARILRDQPMHLLDRRGDSLLVSIVESEPHTQNVATNEALLLIRLESRRIAVTATVETGTL